MKLKMPNSGRKKISPKLSITQLSIAILILSVLLGGCSLFSDNAPRVVGEPTTLVPATPTLETPATQEGAAAETEEPTQSAPAVVTSPTPILQAGSLPDPNLYSWSLFASGLDRPVFLTHAGDQSGRLFVIEKAGRIQIFQDGGKLAEPFLDITQLVNSQDSERGLLGLGFHPKYTENGLFYVNYTNLNGDTVVARYQVSADQNRADPNSQQVLLTISQPYPNHNGGMIAFGPDGFLYIGMGDGGSGGDPQGNAQNPNTLLGKILRIDVDSGTPYGIPAGNAPGGLPEIWALGLRNPWRFSFDRVTGDLLIADVGQNQWEEINILPAGISGGSNLGWDYYEGTHSYEGTPPAETSLIFPVIEYQHDGGKCSVTGGYTYRGTQFPEWQGVYLYGDYCAGIVWGAIPDANGNWQIAQLFKIQAALSSFGEDQSGGLYLLDLNGSIYTLSAK